MMAWTEVSDWNAVHGLQGRQGDWSGGKQK
jgi:hypothetical protein